MMSRWLIFIFLLCSANGLQAVGKTLPPYKDASLSPEERARDLLARMTLEEKIAQLSGVGFDTVANQRLGIPAVSMADGPAGVRKGTATAFPSPVALAASWDRKLLYDVGNAIGLEAESKGVSYLLGPCINIHRLPLGGRNFESYGEDPYLAAEMAVPYIKGIQSNHVLAAAKHFAVNNQEWNRSKVNVLVDERALREIYFPAFKAAVQRAGTHTVMTAYNVVNGIYSSEHDYLLNQVLKKEWGFKGYVVSDWGAITSTVATALAGLDLEMPFAEFYGDKLLDAVKAGQVSEQLIDDKIYRIMRARFEAGIFDTKLVNAPLPGDVHRELALRAAEAGIVLLKNQNKLLPLDPNQLDNIALIGPNAIEAVTGAGGSSMVVPHYAVSPYQGVRNYVGDKVKLSLAPGVAIANDILPLESRYLSADGKPGLLGEYYKSTDLSGEPVMRRQDKLISFFWSYGAPHSELHAADDNNSFSIRWTGTIHPPVSGEYEFMLMPKRSALYIDDQLVIKAERADDGEDGLDAIHTGRIVLEKGRRYAIRIEYFQYEWESGIKLGWRIPGRDLFADAVNAAKQADIAIVFAGLSSRHEGEGNDRETLDLPKQDKLIAAVAAANKNTIVVLETGTPVSMHGWHDDVAAIVQAWYPGQEGGNAIANVLFGKTNPSAKLPFSYIKGKQDSPAFNAYRSADLKARYEEGIFVGYRYLDAHRIKPRYPFGHGLSYTEFEYRNLKVKPAGDNSFKVTINIRNVGKRAGYEVVQLYVHDHKSRLKRPPKELKAFEKVWLEAGAEKTVTLTLTRSAFSYYDPDRSAWVLEPGKFDVLLGSSSRDIRTSKTMSIQSDI